MFWEKKEPISNIFYFLFCQTWTNFCSLITGHLQIFPLWKAGIHQTPTTYHKKKTKTLKSKAFTLGKALGSGLYQNQAHAPLHLVQHTILGFGLKLYIHLLAKLIKHFLKISLVHESNQRFQFLTGEIGSVCIFLWHKMNKLSIKTCICAVFWSWTTSVLNQYQTALKGITIHNFMLIIWQLRTKL